MDRVTIAFAALALGGAALATPSFADKPGNPANGQFYAERVCSVCHSLDPAVRRVPEGRPASFRMIANAPGMTSTALEVWFRTPHPTMPNFVIPETERDNVIAYIMAFKDR